MLSLVTAFCMLALCSGASLRPEIREAFPDSRVVGGTETDISAVPYMLSLEWNGYNICGAVIISTNFALTAAHCVTDFKARQLQVRTNSSLRGEGGSLLQVKTVLSHGLYENVYFDYDIAVLEVEGGFELGEGSQVVGVTEKEPVEGMGRVSGWGDLEENSNVGSKTLHSVELPIVDRAVCNSNYSVDGQVNDRMICAGAPGKDSCQYDSGGPLVLEGLLVGLVSWGLGCGRPGYPGVYTNLAHVGIRSFIREHSGV